MTEDIRLPITVYLPPELKERLKKVADEEHRSLAAQALLIISEHFERLDADIVERAEKLKAKVAA